MVRVYCSLCGQRVMTSLVGVTHACPPLPRGAPSGLPVNFDEQPWAFFLCSHQPEEGDGHPMTPEKMSTLVNRSPNVQVCPDPQCDHVLFGILLDGRSICAHQRNFRAPKPYCRVHHDNRKCRYGDACPSVHGLVRDCSQLDRFHSKHPGVCLIFNRREHCPNEKCSLQHVHV